MASGDTLPIAMSKDIAKDFSVSERIYPGEYVYYNGKFYVCKDRDKYETEPWNSSKFEEITVGEAMSDISEDIAGTYSAIDTLAYPGKYYVYNNRIYRRKDSGGSGDWDETKFDLLYPDGIGGDLWGLYQCLGGWFDASATYHKGQYVFRPSSGIYVLCYCCNVDTHTGAWNDDHFTQVQISDVLKNLNTDLAPAFDATLEYSAGAYVTYNGGLYRLTAAHATNETWANTSKVAVSVGDDIVNYLPTLFAPAGFGLGGTPVRLRGGDLNTVETCGFYYWANTDGVTNAPYTDTSFCFNAGGCQIVIPRGNNLGKIAFRTKSSTWGAWYELTGTFKS